MASNILTQSCPDGVIVPDIQTLTDIPWRLVEDGVRGRRHRQHIDSSTGQTRTLGKCSRKSHHT